MKTYWKYLYTDIISIATLVFALAGVGALIHPDEANPRTYFWICWALLWMIANISYYIYQVSNYNKHNK